MPLGGELLQNEDVSFARIGEVSCRYAVVRAGNTCESYSNITRHALDIVGEGEQVGENALTVFIVGCTPLLAGTVRS